MNQQFRWLRRIYRAMLYAYPASFRGRYGDEMTQVFVDRFREASQSGLIPRFLLYTSFDWARSVVAERIGSLQSATDLAAAPTWSGDGVPAFYVSGSDTPARKALIEGGIISLLVFAALAFAVAHWGGHRIAFTIGAPGSFTTRLGVDQRTGIEDERKTKVRVATDQEEVWHRFVSSYFRDSPVLQVLDRNHDLVISPDEIANAAARLRLLDVTGDGKLDAVECGLVLFREPQPGTEWPKEAARRYMRFHPILAALDSNHDGEISADEIRNSSAALKKLVRNKDCSLTADELVPYRR